MTTGEFADKVFQMREAQKKYFKTRSREALQLSKQLEEEIDNILENRKNRNRNIVQQGELFSESEVEG